MKNEPGLYKHFNGNNYQLIGYAKNSEDTSEYIVYRALYGERELWIRPAKMWDEIVERDGIACKRFSALNDRLIETERLYLRQLRRDDYDALYAVLGDSDNMRHYPYTFDEKRVRNWIEKNIDRYETFGFGLFAVCLKESGEMIGDCGLTLQNINGVIKPEIGYHLRKDMQRKGYAKESALAVRDWAFENTTFKKVYSYMKKDNIASSEIAKSIGMTLVDEYLDEENEYTQVYSVERRTVMETKNLIEPTDPISMLEQGNAYYYGEGVDLDLEKACYWYSEASKQGNAKAKCLLGYCLKKGIGTEVNEIEAFRLFKESAELGFPMAIFNLGECYEKGIGCDIDIEKSNYYYNQASSLGYNE